LTSVFVAHLARGSHSLGRRGVLGKLDSLRDVALETIVASLEKLLLCLVGAADDIDGLLSTAGAELDGDGEELSASSLSNGIASLNTGQVDETGLDETLLALGGADDLVGESTNVSLRSVCMQSHCSPVTSVSH
jgi:hypothetical protein